MTQPVFTATQGGYSERNQQWDTAAVGDHLRIKFQDGPVQEFGQNGVQLVDVLKVCLSRYEMLNKAFPCRENSLAITKLQEAIFWDRERTERRTARGVEGTDKA